MAGYPPPYPPQIPPTGQDWRYQRRVLRDQARAQRDMIRAQRDAYRDQMRGLRRGSIVGPLLVIAVGVVFLLVQTGHLHGSSLSAWYARWWPLLLVGVGVVLLVEWAFDRNAAQNNLQSNGNVPYVRHTVGGGVISLLILMAIVGIGFSGFRGFNGEQFAHGFNFNPDNIDEFLGDKHESDQNLDQAFPENTALTVNSPRGDVTISGTSDDGRIHIAVHKQVYTRSDSDAENRARDLAPQITTQSTGSGSILNLTLPTLEGTHADLIITLPGTAPVTITANHGDVHVNSVKAPVMITANHGDVEISAITGPTTTRINNGSSSYSAHSVTGTLRVDGRGRDLTLSDINGPVTLNGEFFGDTHVEHIRGPVKFHTSRTDFQLARLDGEMEISPRADLSASEALGPILLNTRNRNITLERIAGDVSVTNRNGSVDLSTAPPLGNISVENRSGSVNLSLPDQANFVVQAQTSNGDAENDFSLPTQQSESRKSFAGTIGKGGSLVRINTSEGDISLKKANLSPLPPLTPMPPLTPTPRKEMDITSNDGSSVHIGKDGVKIISGSDGSQVIIGKDGLNIKASSDGSSVYRAPNGTHLVEGSDGSKSYTASSGLHFTQNADGSIVYNDAAGTRYTRNSNGSKSYQGKDGTRFTVDSDGTRSGIGPNGKPLSDSQIRDHIQQADDAVRKAQQEVARVERERESQRKKETSER